MQSDRTFKNSYQSSDINQHNSISLLIQDLLIKLCKSAQTVLDQDLLNNLAKIIESLQNNQQNYLKAIQNTLYLLLSQVQTLKQKKINSYCQKDYQILQQSLQKAQSEVRKHIRIQQQLKLYLDGIQQKNQALQKQLKIQENKYNKIFQSMRTIHQQKKQLQRKLKKIEEKYKYLNQKDKVKGYKSTKLLSESINRGQIYSVSISKSKPTLINHFHSRSKHNDKNSQKSFQKQLNMLPRKINKSKGLQDQIDVNISKNTYQQSKQSYEQVQNHKQFVPTQQDIKIFRQMTKTVQMKQAYKKPVRKITKYKTQGKQIKEKQKQKQIKELKQQNQMKQTKNSLHNQGKQYRSITSYK